MNETTERFVNTPDGDDGGLQCLNIPPNPNRNYFNCRETTQGRLQNSTFYVIDFQEVKKTKFGVNQKYVVKIKDRLNDPESAAQKFFTGSKDIIYILDKLREMDKLPRRVTLRGSGMNYWFE